MLKEKKISFDQKLPDTIRQEVCFILKFTGPEENDIQMYQLPIAH